jgi:pyridoxamine--pyruvate transaminase
VFSSGRGETLGKLVRIGHMGPTARPMYAVVAVTALGGALHALGHPLDVAAGVAAALAVIDDGVDGKGAD